MRPVLQYANRVMVIVLSSGSRLCSLHKTARDTAHLECHCCCHPGLDSVQQWLCQSVMGNTFSLRGVGL